MSKTKSKFKRQRGPRRSFFKSLMNSLILAERIETTEARAKALRPLIERLVTIAKKGQLADRRAALSRLPNKKAALKLFYEIAPKYKERPGGYTRIVKLGQGRKRDSAKRARIEFV